jgi:hypothetical protein
MTLVGEKSAPNDMGALNSIGCEIEAPENVLEGGDHHN